MTALSSQHPRDRFCDEAACISALAQRSRLRDEDLLGESLR